MTDPQTLDTTDAPTPNCPKCQGEMWDNRASKRNPRAPDFKCKDKGCDGVVWPPRDANAPPAAPTGTADDPACPVCGGKMWDDRLSKRNPRAPDFKCRNKPKVMGGPGCPGVIWPPRDGQRGVGSGESGVAGSRPGSHSPLATPNSRNSSPQSRVPANEPPPPDDRDFDPSFGDDDDLPF